MLLSGRNLLLSKNFHVLTNIHIYSMVFFGVLRLVVDVWSEHSEERTASDLSPNRNLIGHISSIWYKTETSHIKTAHRNPKKFCSQSNESHCKKQSDTIL